VFDLQKDDFGKYKCVAENSLGVAEAELQLYGTGQAEWLQIIILFDS